MLTVAALFAVTLFVPATALAAAVKIMPLGDSITSGTDGHGSYRYWLWKDLETLGYQVDFVGTLNGVYMGSPFGDYDQDHDGHSNWRADEVLVDVQSWVAQELPDIVMIHLGTVDIAQGHSNASTIVELGQIIDEIRLAKADVVILLGQIISSSVFTTQIPDLNSMIPGLAASKDQPGSPVIVVDHETPFDPALHTYDGVHPNDAGEQVMGDAWEATLVSVLDNWEFCCTFTAMPNPATSFEPVSFDATGSFHPSPTKSILSWDWSFGDGQFGVGQTTSHTYFFDSLYDVVLTLTDNTFTTHPCTLTVNVLGPLPVEPSSWGRIKNLYPEGQ